MPGRTEDQHQFGPYTLERELGRGSFGAVYLAARAGAVLLDPSFPGHYGLVKQVPAWAAASAAIIGLTLRPDTAD